MNDALSGPERTELLHSQPIPVFLNRRLADIFGLKILDNVAIYLYDCLFFSRLL